MPPVIRVEKCTGCRHCYEYCPMDVFGFDEDKDVAVVLYPLECWHCGVCEIECPAGAIDVELPPEVRIGLEHRGEDSLSPAAEGR
jgi:adenylylsulfate reductase subunit B